MSSTVTQLQPTERTTLISSSNSFWIRIGIHTIFGCVFLLHSLFFVLSYATFDFFGARNSPFFEWLRQLNFVLKTLYFPTLIGALLCVGAGETRENSRRAKRLAFLGVVTQVCGGAILILLQTKVGLSGWALLFGPTSQSVIGYVAPYTQAIAGLVPLAWISAIHVRTSIRAAGNETITNSSRLSSFLLAGLTVSFLYMGTAWMRWAASDQPFTLSTLSFSMAAHLVAFSLVFVILRWIRFFASRFANPGLAQFALRAITAWIVIAFLIRRVIFALLSFNDNRANVYAVLLSLAGVLFALSLSSIIKDQQAARHKREAAIPPPHRWATAACALLPALSLFYLSDIKFAAVDWEHVLSCVAALITSILILWFFLALSRPVHNYRTVFLVAFSFLVVVGLVGLRAVPLKEQFAIQLEQYSDYDPSFFLIQQALMPAIQENSYSDWYRFLAHHANIRQPVQAPDVPLTDQLKPSAVKKPNIFIFVIDALRRDYVSAYNPAVTFTPSLGAFAKESLVFQHAYSGYAGTELAVPAILSGIQQLNKTFPEPVRRFNHLQDMLNVDQYDCYTSYNPIVAALATKSDGITNLSDGMEMDDQQDFRPIIRKLEDTIRKRKDKSRPIFVYSQPANVHTLYLTWHRGRVDVKPHPGFDEEYASAVEQVDTAFGEFISFLKEQGLYENSIVIVTADHGESLGEMGRHGHVNYLTPEVIQIPLMIHVAEQYMSNAVVDPNQMVSLHDITPTLYFLLGHGPLRQGEMIGRPLVISTRSKQVFEPPDHYFLMSSYMPIFGVISRDRKNLFFVDAVLNRSFYYDLQHDPDALKKRMPLPIRNHYETIIRQDLEAIDEFYGLTEQQLAQRDLIMVEK